MASKLNKESIQGELLPKKTGPKSKYEVWMCAKIIEVASQGGHIAAMRAAIGHITKDTWYRWKEDYPEFKEAVETAECASQEYWENIGALGITGQIKGFNGATYIHLMANKFKDDYSRGSVSDKTEINLTTNTINLAPEQLTQRINQRLEQLQSLGVDIVKNADTK